MAIVILNFKAYEQAVGANSIKLAAIASDVSEELGVPVIVAPQTADLERVSNVVSTYAQHIDPIDFGSGTGSMLAEAAKAAGAKGSLLNHSERRIPEDVIKKSVEKLRKLDMKSVVCAKDSDESQKLSNLNPEHPDLNPDYIAVEPPELIGSGISVSTAKPEVISDTVSKIREVNKTVGILCGAGISTGVDVKKAVELGAEGVLLASAFTKAEDTKKVLQDICGGF